MENQSNEFNIFYHNKQKLDQILKMEDFNDNYNFIDLNSLLLPAELENPGLDPILNKAIYSEYLGILTLKPRKHMVGCFTYSIQTKFSARWALECGSLRFLPPINFVDLSQCEFEPSKLYAVEMNSPRHLVPQKMDQIITAFPLSRVPEEGPFKGSFVVSREVFLDLQEWLLSVIKYVLSSFQMNEITEVSSPFDKSIVSKRTPEELIVDKLRHTYGSLLERAVAYFLGAHFGKNRVVLIGEHIHKRKMLMEFEHTCNERSKSGDIIISFGNFAYKEVVVAWLEKLHDVGVMNYVFIAMDRALFDFLSQRRYSVVLQEFDGALADFWAFRLKTINRLLGIGLNVVHSDSDAFWLKNPMPVLRAIPGDLISSQGTIFPLDCWKEWGFVLCCGFQYFRPTIATLAFFEELIPLVEEVRDDQIAMNCLLVKHQTTWSTPEFRYQLSIKKKVFDCFTEPVFGESAKSLKLCLLPHRAYQRLLEEDVDNTFILHLLSDKKKEVKLQRLNEIEAKLNRPEKVKAEVIWLASYPRSGNTLTRTIFKHNFGLDSYSLYNDRKDIGKYESIRKFVGHQDGEWGFKMNGHRQIPHDPIKVQEIVNNEPVLIKTHSQYDDFYKDFKVIYVIREPRSVLTSYVSYKQNFAGVDLPSEEILNELIFDGDKMSGFWSEHAEGWLSNKKGKFLVLKYEDILSDFSTELKRIASFIGRSPINTELVDFNEYKKANSVFFRKGKGNSWKDSLPVLYQEKIIHSAQNQILSFAYSDNIEENEATIEINNVGPSKPGKWVYICTPVFNAEKTIDQTIQSVVSQAGDFFLHYHVQDGGSSDATLDKLNSWESLLKNNSVLVNCSSLTFTYESSPDIGIYDAINKAFRSMNITRNALMGWINADDVLIPGAVETVATIFEQFPNEDWIIPSPYTMGEQCSHRGRRRNGHPATPRSIAGGLCDGKQFSFIQQEGLFWKSDLWHRVGGLDVDLKFAGDWDLWRRYALISTPVYVEFHLGIFRKRPGQLSENAAGYMAEVERIKQTELKKSVEHIPDYRRLVSLGPNGSYIIEASKSAGSEHSCSIKSSQENIALNNKSKACFALEKYRETNLNNYLIEAVREKIREPMSDNNRQQLINACKENDFKTLLETFNSFDRSTKIVA